MISIIIPVYNVEKYLPKCLDSVLQQTYSDTEVICVNDGSTDRSIDILEHYALADSRVKIISRENRGISVSRNEALDVAKGEWVMFVDSDDWTDEGTCEKALAIAKEQQADTIMWGYTREYEGRSLAKLYFDSFKVWESDIKELHRRMVGPIKQELRSPDTMDAWGTIWGKLYKRECIEQPSPIRFVDTRVIGSAEDVLFNIDYMGRIQKAVYLPDSSYHYRKINSSYTFRHKEGLAEKWNHLYNEISKRLQESHLPTEYIEAFHNRVSLGLIGLGLNEVFSSEPYLVKRKNIKRLLQRPLFRESITQLEVKWLPTHWRVFFICAKYKFPDAILLLLSIIKRIIQR